MYTIKYYAPTNNSDGTTTRLPQGNAHPTTFTTQRNNSPTSPLSSPTTPSHATADTHVGGERGRGKGAGGTPHPVVNIGLLTTHIKLIFNIRYQSALPGMGSLPSPASHPLDSPFTHHTHRGCVRYAIMPLQCPHRALCVCVCCPHAHAYTRPHTHVHLPCPESLLTFTIMVIPSYYLPSTANFYTRRNTLTDITSHSLALHVFFFISLSFLFLSHFGLKNNQTVSVKDTYIYEIEMHWRSSASLTKEHHISPGLIPGVREAEIAILILCLLSPLNKCLNR